MEAIIASSVKHLKMKSYHFPNGWVEACIEWLFEEHQDNVNEMTNNKWCDLIEQQWLFSDLRDFDTPSSLNNISVDFMKFNGICCLQIMSFKNVSKSCYSQIRELNGTVNENTCVSADDTNYINSSLTNRTLMLSLTDSVNEISAFEFQPWGKIETHSISVGSKCCLKGPFIIRKKIAFLKPENIVFLGGEVEDLSTTTQLSIIEEQLRINTSKSTILSVNKIKKEIKTQKSMPKINVNLPTNVVNNMKQSESKSIIKEFPPRIHQSHIKTNLVCSSTINNNNNIEITKDRKNLEQISNPINDSRITECNDFEFDQFDEDDEYLLMNLPLDENVLPSIEVMEQNDKTSQDNNKERVVENVTIENYQTHMVKEEHKIDVKIEDNQADIATQIDEDEPFMNLLDIFTELSKPEANDITVRQFKVQGAIVNICTKLKILMDSDSIYRWNLEVLLNDGTASVTCLLDDELISKKIGVTAQLFQEMKKSKLTDQFKNSVRNFQDYISKSNCGAFVLQVSENCDKLCIVEHYPIDSDIGSDVKRRISQIL